MHKFKRIGSLLMALAMIVSLIPNVGAAEVYEDTGDDAYFDLNAEEYEFREDGGDQKIIVKRTGNLGVEVDVAFKVADFLTSYGEDYVVLNAAGRPLAKIDGVKPDVSDITVEESDAGIIEEAPPAAVTTPEAATEEPPVTTETPVESTETATDEPVAETEPAEEATETVEASDEPAEEVTETVEASDEPAEEATETVEASDEPAEDVAEQVVTDVFSAELNAAVVELDADEPAEEATEAAETSDEPAEEATEAVETSDEPADETTEAAETSDEPADETTEAVETSDEPADEATEAAETSDESADETTEAAETSDEPADETTEAVETSDEPAGEATETVETSDEPADEVAEPVEDADAANVKRAYSTGSPLRDAAYGYLGIDGEQATLQSAEISRTEREIEELLTETNAYFQNAQGAEGVLHFNKGETEQAITVRPTNDSQSNGTRVFLVALMGVLEGQRGRIAPDANAYVSLIDDEEREAPTYSLAAGNITLTEENPAATVTVTRTSGLADFSTAYLSTIKPTADAAPTYEYQQFNGRSVQFLPGETEKEVTVKALYFDKSGKFGLRLEAADENAAFGNAYAEINIRATETEEELVPAAPEAELLAAYPDEPEETPMTLTAPTPVQKDTAQLQAGELTLTVMNDDREVWTGNVSVNGQNQAYYVFTPAVSATYTFESTSDSDTYGYLYDSSRNQIASNDDGGSGWNFRIQYNLNAGTTYYYGVRWFSSSRNGVIPVRLTQEATPLRALRVGQKVTDTAVIGAAGGTKIYSFTPTVSGTYTFRAINSSAATWGYLYDSNRDRIAATGTANGNFTISQHLNAGTAYYFGAKMYSNSITGTITVELAAPAPTPHAIGRASFSPDGMWNGSFNYDVWGTEKTGSDSDNYAFLSSNAIWVGQYDEDKYAYGYTKRPYDMTGVYQLSFHSSMGGDGSNFHTIFETDTDQTWPGSINHERKNGKYGKQDTFLSVATENRELYIKWGTQADDWGKQNPRGWLENVTFYYTFYRLLQYKYGVRRGSQPCLIPSQRRSC